MDKLNIGIIGCGGIMNHHVSGILTFPDINICAVADKVKERSDAMAKRTGAKNSYASHAELFEAEKSLDAVFIAVEPTAHTNIEETAIEKGVPFFVEKPMTLDMEQAKKISDLVEQKGLITAVGFQDRYLDVIDLAKEELKDMQVGIVYSSWIGGVPQVWWWMKKSTCGGQLIEQNIHHVDMLRNLFGEAESVYAVCGRGILNAGHFPSELPPYDTDDYSTAVIKFKSGVIANVMSACYVKDGSAIRNGMTIIGRDKSLEYEIRNSLTIYKKNTTKKITNTNKQLEDIDRTFLNAVKTGDKTIVRSPYPDAYKTLILADAANRSMETGNAIKL